MQKHALACLFSSVVVGVVCSVCMVVGLAARTCRGMRLHHFFGSVVARVHGSRVGRRERRGHAFASFFVLVCRC